MAKVYVFLADGFEESEALIPIDLMRRAGIEVETVSIMDSLLVTGRTNVTMAADKMFAEIVTEEAVDMIMLPGGIPGTPNLRQHKSLERLIEYYKKNDKYLAAICAAPTVYGEMGLLIGKKATCYPGLQEKLFGAEFVEESVVVDGQFITSRGLGTAMDFALVLIETLVDKETADKVAESIVYSR